MSELKFNYTVHAGKVIYLTNLGERYPKITKQSIEITYWLNSSCTGRWTHRYGKAKSEQYESIFYFENEEDAILFKLTVV